MTHRLGHMGDFTKKHLKKDPNKKGKIYDAGTLKEFTIETKGPPPIKSRPPAKIETSEPRNEPVNVVNTELRKMLYGKKSLEGRGLNIKPGEELGLEGGSDYWVTQQGHILEDVKLGRGNNEVTGVNTPKPGLLQRKKFKRGKVD